MKVLRFHEWCPIRPNGTPATIGRPSRAWLHHGAKGRAWSLNTAIGHARYHIVTLGWQTVGYSALVVLHPEPMLLLGRVLQHGAHTRGYQRDAGICVPGNVTSVPDAGISAVAEALRIGASEGWWPARLAGGHRDVGQTACPGSPLHARIPAINARVGSTPAPDPEPDLPDPEEDEMIVTFDSGSRRYALYTGSGYVVHLSPSANGQLRDLRDKPWVEHIGEAPGLEQAGIARD